MKNTINTMKKAFTLMEMIIVVGIIGLLMYMFLGNGLSKGFLESVKIQQSKVASEFKAYNSDPNNDLDDYYTNVFGDTAGVSEGNAKDVAKTIADKIKVAPDYIRNQSQQLLTMIEKYKVKCNKIEVKTFNDSKTAISSITDKNNQAYSTDDSAQGIDLVCSLKKKENGKAKAHTVYTTENISVIHGNKTDLTNTIAGYSD